MTSARAKNGVELIAGAAIADVTPQTNVFLFGYPHVARTSTGVNDPLQCAALYLQSGADRALFLANDLIFVTKALAAEVRRRIGAKAGMPEESIMITATHTHSGPVTVNYVSNGHDPIVPKADPNYLRWVADRMVEAAGEAIARSVPAEIGLAVARAEGVGTNRHDVKGPADPDVPVLLVRSAADHVPLGCMVVYAMHPTVLHEDSTLVSGDFPHYAREYLRQHGLPAGCPVIYHNGASGNQSPRHVTKANTFAEAKRLGDNLGAAIAAVLPGMTFHRDIAIASRRTHLEFELRKFGTPSEALATAGAAWQKLLRLRQEGAPRTAVRTAECDWFGADETVELTLAASTGRLEEAARGSLPAEIQLIEIGPWRFLGWPGEFFVEYALAIRAASPSTFVITMANGELQGYIVTEEAVAQGVYEATNAVFAASNGARVVAASQQLLRGPG